MIYMRVKSLYVLFISVLGPKKRTWHVYTNWIDIQQVVVDMADWMNE